MLTTQRPGQTYNYSTCDVTFCVDDSDSDSDSSAGRITGKPYVSCITTFGDPVQIFSHDDYLAKYAVCAYPYLWEQGADRVEFTDDRHPIISAIRERQQFYPGDTANRKIINGDSLLNSNPRTGTVQPSRS